MLHFLDIFLTFLHFLIIGFVLFGWITPITRKAHFICTIAIAASWLLLGMWFGIGYCPVTDWQWDVKTKLGEQNLPSSFIKYFADKITRKDISSFYIDIITATSFAIAVLLSVYVNFLKKARKES
ncbi:MAG: DUF2784 domain-containing protein [Chitinophagaceae bacterium]